MRNYALRLARLEAALAAQQPQDIQIVITYYDPDADQHGGRRSERSAAGTGGAVDYRDGLHHIAPLPDAPLPADDGAGGMEPTHAPTPAPSDKPWNFKEALAQMKWEEAQERRRR